jgi:hypothetical protein
MNKLVYVLITLLPLALVGCGSGGGTSAAEEAKLHSELAGPPKVGSHRKMGANPKAEEYAKQAAATAGGQAPSTGQ